MKADLLHLPGKKKLREEGTQVEVIVIDATESPEERPQKNSGGTTVGKRSAISRNLSSL